MDIGPYLSGRRLKRNDIAIVKPGTWKSIARSPISTDEIKTRDVHHTAISLHRGPQSSPPRIL